MVTILCICRYMYSGNFTRDYGGDNCLVWTFTYSTLEEISETAAHIFMYKTMTAMIVGYEDIKHLSGEWSISNYYWLYSLQL
jgi:hypothetical protein